MVIVLPDEIVHQAPYPITIHPAADFVTHQPIPFHHPCLANADNKEVGSA